MAINLTNLGGSVGSGQFQSDNFRFALQSALSAYSDEMYTNAKKLSGTGIVGSNAQIDPSTETYIGQTRFFKPYGGQTVNVASATDAAPGAQQGYQSQFLTYVKTVRTHGAREVNVQRVISQMDGLAKIARDFGEVRAGRARRYPRSSSGRCSSRSFCWRRLQPIRHELRLRSHWLPRRR